MSPESHFAELAHSGSVHRCGDLELDLHDRLLGEVGELLLYRSVRSRLLSSSTSLLCPLFRSRSWLSSLPLFLSFSFTLLLSSTLSFFSSFFTLSLDFCMDFSLFSISSLSNS
ncbi:hypothetical protein JZ751_006844 [Albula glossodonta]|uniref:Uncharacterized protein n=1 Tax=Albula glossodonta TaxID=121402 RepID=A0A8T2NZJ3_9TELE|nr:hypothetical protein JZ751_006844 [Albula glossodonta]